MTSTDLGSRQAAADRGLVVAWHAGRRPDATAVVAPTGTRTYRELDERANRLVNGALAWGVAPGDPVAVVCSNRVELVEVVVAAQRAGWRLTPVNWHLTGPEAAYVIENCEATVVFVEDHLRPIADAVPEGPRRVIVGDRDCAGWRAYEDLLAAGAPTDELGPHQARGTTMLYTSGTTGRPKGVDRPAVGPSLVPAEADLSGYHDTSAHLCTGPLYHAAPLHISLEVPLHGGAAVVLMDRWDPHEFLRLVAVHRITHTHLVPTMFHRLLALPDDVRTDADVSSLRLVVHGAAPCPIEVKRRMIEWLGPIIVEYYAATEGAATLVDSTTWLAKPGTVGRPTPPERVVVGDDDAVPLPTGTVGKVWILSPPEGRFSYFGDPDKTRSAQRGDYFTLGDLGYLDEDGYLFLTDRDANLVVTGGVNVYPAEVDAVLLEHPSVADAATIGLPDEEWGEVVHAVVEVSAEVAPTEELGQALLAHCRDRLAHFKCPRTLDVIDRLPREDNGKIYKRRIRDAYREGRISPVVHASLVDES